MTLPRLEQKLIDQARDYLAACQRFYARVEAGTVSAEDRSDYVADRAALLALLAFSYLPDSGVTEEGRAALLAIEADTDAAVRGYQE
jgi:hypothetical protein